MEYKTLTKFHATSFQHNPIGWDIRLKQQDVINETNHLIIFYGICTNLKLIKKSIKKQEDSEKTTILNHQILIPIICSLFHSSFSKEHMISLYNKEPVDQLILLSLHSIIITCFYPNANLNN